MDAETPMVSVIMLTHNQKRYVRQAVESVLMQEADFKYELLIFDDASTDGTKEIIAEYAAACPEIVRLHINETNVGASRNAYGALMASAGRYLAFCEGDDYWIRKDKLQRQVLFLEEHPEYIGCAGRSLLVSETGSPLRRQRLSWVKRKRTFTYRDFSGGKYLPGQTASILKRNIFLNSSEDWSILTFHPQISDRFATLVYLLRGNFSCLPETFSAYRCVSDYGKTNLTSVLYKDNRDRCRDELEMTEALERYASDCLGKKQRFHRKRADILLDALITVIRSGTGKSVDDARGILRSQSLHELICIPVSALEKIRNKLFYE